MTAPAVRPLMATPRPSDKKVRISNRELDLLEPLLTYTKQTTAPLSNRELSTISFFHSPHQPGFDRRASLFGADRLSLASKQTMTKRPKPIVLTVLDGWGYRAETKGNAIALARKPNYDRILKNFPNTLIQTSGPAVGLPVGQMGNSEVGHLNIGAGRIVHMDSTRIDALIASGEFSRQPLLIETMERARTHQLHLMGLVSDGGVHSHIEHLYALLRMARENKVERVFVHCFMDGRDTPPESGIDFLRALQQKMREYGVGEIATVTGRYYAMDRDNRWERVGAAYRAVVHGAADIRSTDPIAMMQASYEKSVTDEFVLPSVIITKDEPGKPAAPRGVIRDDDAVIFF